VFPVSRSRAIADDLLDQDSFAELCRSALGVCRSGFSRRSAVGSATSGGTAARQRKAARQRNGIILDGQVYSAGKTLLPPTTSLTRHATAAGLRRMVFRWKVDASRRHLRGPLVGDERLLGARYAWTPCANSWTAAPPHDRDIRFALHARKLPCALARRAVRCGGSSTWSTSTRWRERTPRLRGPIFFVSPDSAWRRPRAVVAVARPRFREDIIVGMRRGGYAPARLAFPGSAAPTTASPTPPQEPVAVGCDAENELVTIEEDLVAGIRGYMRK
jgi:hypothetical protein